MHIAAEICRKRNAFREVRSMTVGSSAKKNRIAFGLASVSIRLARNALQPCWLRVPFSTSTRSAGAVQSL
jgi:hypothetical protein